MDRGTWKHDAAGRTAVDFLVVSAERRGEARRGKHAQPDAAVLVSARSLSDVPDFFLPILERSVQLEGKVSFSLTFLLKKFNLFFFSLNK